MMTENSDARSEQDQWPAVETAYGFVLPSYQLLAARYEAADGRLTALITVATTITLGTPMFAKAIRPAVTFGVPVFVLAMAFAVTALIVAMAGRARGRIVLPNPGVLYRKSLAETDWTFKKNAIFYAGQHFDANAATVARKHLYETIASTLLTCEAFALIIWLIV
jgi:hypothetical protein